MEEIAEAVGRARSCIQRWFDIYRSRGLKGVLYKAHAGGVESMLRAPVASEMIEKLLEGKWRRAVDVRRWFAQEHGVEVALSTVYKYLGKSEVRLKVPRPSHARKDAAAAETFKSELAAKLRELDIEQGRIARLIVSTLALLHPFGSNLRFWEFAHKTELHFIGGAAFS